MTTTKKTKPKARKPLPVTLSDEALARLERLADRAGLTLSQAVEALVRSPVAGPEIMLGAEVARGVSPDAAAVEKAYGKA